ncbi:lipase maturation factor family protein [Bdellovibrio bacteriovorus]|nr:lipase maturation factor family protein [Bdellovibrio bacteriovorus]
MISAMELSTASWLLAKTLSLSYFIAFLSLLPQVLGLFGREGLLSIDHFLNILDKEMRAERFFHLPSVFWLGSSDMTLKAVCFIGMTAASLSFLGFSQSIMLAICFVCYLSFVSCGQVFLSYQWDSLLLEFGFLGLFFAPLEWEWLPLGTHLVQPLIYFLALFLLFKLMFLSGVAKLVSKDTTWRNFTALNFHYWTQPLPTPLAYFASKLPPAIQKISVAMMFVIELVFPFLIWYPGPWQTAAVIGFVGLQVLIAATGNYGFFNLITLGLSLSVLPDSTWGFKIGWVEKEMIAWWATLIPLMVVGPSSVFWIYKSLFEKSKVMDFLLPWMRALYPFRISNPYGLFAIMTRTRPEIVMEGSDDEVNWKEYQFNHKVTSLKKMPTVVAPHQPRLDWQMWFAALETFNDNLWLQNLVTRIFQKSQDVLALLGENPFPQSPPKFIRFLRYEYEFSKWDELRENRQWWKRKLVGPYGPLFERDDFSEEETP